MVKTCVLGRHPNDDNIIQTWHKYLYCKNCIEELHVGSASSNLVQVHSSETVTDKLLLSMLVPQHNGDIGKTD